MTLNIESIGLSAKHASSALALTDSETKNKVLRTASILIKENRDKIKTANSQDIESARSKNLSKSIIDRLTLTDNRIDDMISGLLTIAGLPDPTGSTLESWQQNKIKITKISAPIGVILMIYESRPNITIDAAALCLKSGNAVILKGGSDAYHSNKALADIFVHALSQSDIPKDTLQLIDSHDKSIVKTLLKLNQYIDLVIPRGGTSLVKFVTENSVIPVIKHLHGVCNMYIDIDADLELAEKLVINAKCQRPGVCNAIENLVIHKSIAERFLPKIVKQLRELKVQVRGDEQTNNIIDVILADEQDWATEYLDLIISIKVVENITEAIKFINKYGSKHSDAIVSNNSGSIRLFNQCIDSSAIFNNTSTRFNDGFEFGFGAEIGISTDKLHARGPVALKELTTYKYIVKSQGEIRE